MSIKTYYETYWSPTGFNPKGYIKPPLETLFRRHLSPGNRCLDLGCGDGRTCGTWLTNRGYTYVGVDVSETAVRSAQQAGLDAVRIDDAAQLPFADGSFDAVISVEVLEHLFDPKAAAAEMFRVLQPGGRAIITVPNVAYWRRRLELLLLGRWNPMGDEKGAREPWRDPHIRFFNASSLHHMLQAAGFSQVLVSGHAGAVLRDIPWLGRRVACS